MIFNPKSFGAKADGSHDDTNAIQQAIDKAFFSGGGRIVLKNGVFLSGTIYHLLYTYDNINSKFPSRVHLPF